MLSKALYFNRTTIYFSYIYHTANKGLTFVQSLVLR